MAWSARPFSGVAETRQNKHRQPNALRLDLTNQAAVQQFFAQEKPTQVYVAAAKVGGIHANKTYAADFIYQNLMVQANVVDAAFRNGMQKLLFLGPSEKY